MEKYTKNKMEEANKIFNDKASFNKWLLELTESEKSLVVEMIDDALWQGYNNVLFLGKEKQQIVDAFTAGQIDIANTFLAEYKSRGLENELSIPENDKEDGEQYFNNTFKK